MSRCRSLIFDTLQQRLEEGSGLDALSGHVEAKAKKEALKLMQTVKGIGPGCSEMAWELLAV